VIDEGPLRDMKAMPTPRPRCRTDLDLVDRTRARVGGEQLQRLLMTAAASADASTRQPSPGAASSRKPVANCQLTVTETPGRCPRE